MNIQFSHEVVKNDAISFVQAMYSNQFEYLLSYKVIDLLIPCLSDGFLTHYEQVRIFTDGSVLGINNEIIARNTKEWLEEYANHYENANYDAAMSMEQPEYWPEMEGDKG